MQSNAARTASESESSPLLDDRHYLALHVHALYTHDDRGRIVRTNEPTGVKPAPRFYLGRSAHGNLWRCRADLPDDLVQALVSLCADEPIVSPEEAREPVHAAVYARLLESHGPSGHPSQGPAFRGVGTSTAPGDVVRITPANAGVLRGHFDGWLGDVADWQPFVAVVQGGHAVSVCVSVRITAAAHEAGVETAAAWRGRGHAKAVVNAWGQLVRAEGAEPLYSTSWENAQSRAVARGLGLEPFALDYEVR